MTRRNFSPEFRLEAAQLVLDQHYTVAAAATAMNVGKSTMHKWVRQLKNAYLAAKYIQHVYLKLVFMICVGDGR